MMGVDVGMTGIFDTETYQNFYNNCVEDGNWGKYLEPMFNVESIYEDTNKQKMTERERRNAIEQMPLLSSYSDEELRRKDFEE